MSQENSEHKSLIRKLVARHTEQTMEEIAALGIKGVSWEQIKSVQAKSGEAEVLAAHRLSQHGFIIFALCWVLWGRSLSEERDARLAKRPASSPESARARRGRITRTLLDDLADELERRRSVEHQET